MIVQRPVFNTGRRPRSRLFGDGRTLVALGVPTCYRGLKQLKWCLGLPDAGFAYPAGAGDNAAGPQIGKRSQPLGSLSMFTGFFGSFGIFFIINLIIQFVQGIFGIA